jgi:hypothetical protein
MRPYVLSVPPPVSIICSIPGHERLELSRSRCLMSLSRLRCHENFAIFLEDQMSLPVMLVRERVTRPVIHALSRVGLPYRT